MGQTLAVLSGAGLHVTIKPDGKTISVLPAGKLTNDLRQLIIQQSRHLGRNTSRQHPTKRGNPLVQHYGVKLDVTALVNVLLLMGW